MLRVSQSKSRQPSRYTDLDYEHALADARKIMSESPKVRVLASMDIVSRQLYLLQRAALEDEIDHVWEVGTPRLVIDTILASNEARAKVPFTAASIYKDIEETILPALKIFIQAEQAREAQNGETTDPGPESVVPGAADGAAVEVGPLPTHAGGDTVEQAGVSTEGSPGETGQAGGDCRLPGSDGDSH